MPLTRQLRGGLTQRHSVLHANLGILDKCDPHKSTQKGQHGRPLSSSSLSNTFANTSCFWTQPRLTMTKMEDGHKLVHFANLPLGLYRRHAPTVAPP